MADPYERQCEETVDARRAQGKVNQCRSLSPPVLEPQETVGNHDGNGGHDRRRLFEILGNGALAVRNSSKQFASRASLFFRLRH